MEVGDRTLAVVAKELTSAETAAFWLHIVRALPGYARYQRATSRTIPLAVGPNWRWEVIHHVDACHIRKQIRRRQADHRNNRGN